jgi:hypothetical protein
LLILPAGAAAQPALTTIEDILYKADGTRFSGTVYISWISFQGGDSSQIATAEVTLPVVNGVFRVRLVPTTTASPGANYSVRYNSRGRMQFQETWAVPPSTVPLRIRDVRIAQGTVVGPPPVLTQMGIGDVTGLQNELAVRPMRGIGFGPGRAAVINSAGQLDAASGTLSDCVRVDGSSGPCGGGGGGILPAFAEGETPAGLVNGSNTAFVLNYAPSPASSLQLFRNGLLMKQGSDYSLSGKNITFFLASTPQPGDLLQAAYRYGDPTNPLGTLAPAQVICSGTGAGTSSTALTTLGTCTIPAGLLRPGDRVEIGYLFSHEGSAQGIAAEVRWGATQVFSRNTAAGETVLSGDIRLGLENAIAYWSLLSWGAQTAIATGAGTAPESITGAITIAFRGQMLGAGADTVTLRNFRVIRYPSQANP